MPPTQLSLFQNPECAAEIRVVICDLLRSGRQPSAYELIQVLESEVGLEARWQLREIVAAMADATDIARSARDYLRALLETGSLAAALRGADAPNKETISTIDLLLRESRRYRSSAGFQEMIDFIGRFRDYAPYNNMLVRLQNPSCGLYATEKDWRERFSRTLKEDARPMLILAPMHPVMLVYDVDQTEGKPLPQELQKFSSFEGQWDGSWLTRLIKNAAGHRIDVQFKTLSSTNSGFATLARASGNWKMRVVLHDQLNEPSRFGVLCHELAHILLGHLGSDWDYWWPARTNLSHAAVEVEAEATAWIVTSQLGLEGSSATYVSRHLKSGDVPTGVSFDMIAKTAGHIGHMATASMQPKKPRALSKDRGKR